MNNPTNIQVVIPALPKPLFPNYRPRTSRGHAYYRRCVREVRDNVRDRLFNILTELFGVFSPPLFNRVIVTVRFVFPVRRKRDEDNLVAALKSVYDGIVRSGVVADDTVEHMQRAWPTVLILPLHRPVVMIQITPLDREEATSPQLNVQRKRTASNPLAGCRQKTSPSFTGN